MQNYQHWTFEIDGDQIIWLTLNCANSPVNTLGRTVMQEFSRILDHIADCNLRGMIIQSGKKSGFIAGADVNEFTDLKTPEEAFKVIRQGQKILDALANLPIPTLALIKGFCMGGGMELALACRYRVAEDSEATRLGLPEVKLGIQPGWGGSIRLVHCIGVLKAMDVILSGRAIRAKAARAMGFVDLAVPERILETAARSLLLSHTPAHRANFLERLPSSAVLRPVVAWFLRKQLHHKKVNPAHYPAPYTIIQTWAHYGAKGEAAYTGEAGAISQLMLTPTARHLLRVFFLQGRLKELSKGIESHIQKVHVIGAGIMGGDIAAYCALKGLSVTLQDREAALIAPAIKRATALYQKLLRNPRDVLIALDNLIPDPAGLGVQKADLIIEAIFENLEVKQALFKKLEIDAKPTAILASNTSSIPLDEINVVLNAPARLVGIHFFNPVSKMPLVEIVQGAKTDELILKQALKFVTQIGKSPLLVKSSPGFLVNRLLLPYMMEAMLMLDEGISPQAIDQAALDFGMPMGPIELGDTVGLDICLSVATNLTHAFGGQVPSSLVKMVENKNLGKKSGSGFYRYNKHGKIIGVAARGEILANKQLPRDKIASRMIGRMLNEAFACLREGVVKDSDLLDAGMIMGTGFAPFRGGLIQYAKDRGLEAIRKEFTDLEKTYGERFKLDSEAAVVLKD
jgi:3-hydroxyacyl-CoA dehydrogenase/enoyl-CoA hydratase/3-hydroxybutyryl-CoA epimerase